MKEVQRKDASEISGGIDTTYPPATGLTYPIANVPDPEPVKALIVPEAPLP